MMFRLNVPTKRGSILNGVLFRQEEKQVLYKKGQIVQSERVDIICILHSFHNHSNSNMRSRINILIQLQIFYRVKADTIIPEMNDTLLFPYNGANVKEMRPVVFRETISDDIHSHLLDAETYHHAQFSVP